MEPPGEVVEVEKQRDKSVVKIKLNGRTEEVNVERLSPIAEITDFQEKNKLGRNSPKQLGNWG